MGLFLEFLPVGRFLKKLLCYPYLGLYGSAQYGDANGIAYAQFGNDNLRWETSIKYDFGFDLRMFNNRLSLNFDYFLNDTEIVVLKSLLKQE